MSPEFPDRPFNLGGIRPATRDGHKSKDQAPAEEPHEEVVTPQSSQKSVPADQVFSHMAASALPHAHLLKQQASSTKRMAVMFQGLNETAGQVQDMIEQEFGNLSEGAKKHLTHRVMHHLMDKIS